MAKVKVDAVKREKRQKEKAEREKLGETGKALYDEIAAMIKSEIAKGDADELVVEVSPVEFRALDHVGAIENGKLHVVVGPKVYLVAVEMEDPPQKERKLPPEFNQPVAMPPNKP